MDTVGYSKWDGRLEEVPGGLGTQAQLQTVRTKLREAQSKLIQQESALKELSERVTQSLAEAGRDRENIRSELFRALEGVRLGNREHDPEGWRGEARTSGPRPWAPGFPDPPGPAL
ncbi:hypothetical protein E2I00_013658 [Balaenoptera physalus]|uniref:Uncharacterized protein n=1 Tax=Balaenoptera physalus TaxID=9770 RepID=A0A6A1Q2X4_BALPH|nr:hypothetical protein E2I00_013658 [Balaenoptera physalus]